MMKTVKVKTRSINPVYYQKLKFKGDKVVAVSGYIRKKGKDKKIYEKKLIAKNSGKREMLKYARTHDAPEYMIEEIKAGGYKNLKEVKEFLGD